VVFFQFTILAQIETGSIKGRVVDADSNFSLDGVIVFLSNTEIGSVTDLNGYYEIKDIPLGKYTITCYFFAYATQRDTIELSTKNSGIKKNFSLKVLKIPISMSDSLKDYHELFSSYKPNKILNILIDSINQDYEDLYLTFTNKTKHTIYLIEDSPCFNTISVIVRNVKGEVIKHKVASGCDVPGINYLPKENNLIKLKPFSSLSFPPTKIHEFSFNHSNFPKGKYKISVKYEIEDFKYLPGIYSDPDYNYYEKYKDEIKVLNQATRGTFYSVNEIEMKK
jgi:hypothetical protein